MAKPFFSERGFELGPELSLEWTRAWWSEEQAYPIKSRMEPSALDLESGDHDGTPVTGPSRRRRTCCVVAAPWIAAAILFLGGAFMPKRPLHSHTPASERVLNTPEHVSSAGGYVWPIALPVARRQRPAGAFAAWESGSGAVSAGQLEDDKG